jgi:SAM-dependent methyltransferase
MLHFSSPLGALPAHELGDMTQIPASEPAIEKPSKLDGRLIVCPESVYRTRVFYVEGGRRHWVPSVDHLEFYGRSLSETECVSSDEIASLQPAGDLVRSWPESVWRDPPRTSTALLREIAASRLSGTGIEFGGGTYPFCIPLHCEVKFADFVPEANLRDRAYPAQGPDFVPLSYVTSMEELHGIDDDSQDFIVASHVIEHLKNPLRALERCYSKLKRGGTLLLIVPDKRRTFDKDRALTELEHLVLDYEEPSKERDLLHYYEFFSKVHDVPEASLEQRVREAIAADLDIHFHTWTYDTFRVMVEYCQAKLNPWTAPWSQPPIDGLAESQEFYFVLRK